ncbi:terminase large subunit [Butyrivibrio virus Arian]|nr:terminase large subunit [Butyrivibrio virus Arian]
MTHLQTYADMIKRGEVVTGYYMKQEIENLIADLKNPVYIYDTTEADKRIKFQETLCTQSKAPYYGKPIAMMPWQKAFWETLYSFKMADTGKRRFTEALLEIARKNGKSTMFAADGMTDLFIGEGGNDICCASNDDKQAKLIWTEIEGMRSRLDPHKLLTSKNLTEIRNDKKNIHIIRLSSKSANLDGFNFSKVYLDESHDMETDDIAEACWRAMSVKEEPLFMNCTTQGFVNDGYLDKKLETARGIIDGVYDDIHFLPWLYEQDSEQEIWSDKASWEKSNPAIRYGVKKTAKLERDIETAKHDKGARVHLLCKDFNIKQNTAESWLNLDDYAYSTEPIAFEDFKDAYALAAVDLSETTDLTNAKILIMKPGDKTKYIFSHYWIPESKLNDSSDEQSGAKYREWARAGYISICEGNDNDLTQVADWLASLKKLYGIKIVACGYDQRFSKDFLKRMDEYGILCENIPQRPAVMSSPMKWAEADFKAQIINYGANPVDKWNFGNASVQVNNLGQQLAVKINNLPSRRIDGAVTLIILYATLQRFRSEYNTYIGNQ